MKAHTLLTKVAAGLGTVALALTVGACSHHGLATGQDSGEIRTEQTAQDQATSGNTIANAPAPSNAQGVETSSTPAIISGPAKVDNSGRVYTSSSVGSAGNASSTGLNTNVNIIPNKTSGSSTVVVTEVPAPTPLVTVETVPAPVVIETIPEPAPAPIVVEEAPMTSSTTTTETTTTHRRMRKD